MKRYGLAAAVCGLVVLGVTGIAGAAPGDDQGGPYDFVSGAIKRIGLNNTAPDRHFILSAHQTGQGPSGQYTATYGIGKDSVGYKGDVTCVNVVTDPSGIKLARIGIKITESTRADAVVGTYEILRVTDYGVPGQEDAQRDSLSPGVFTAQPANCSNPYEDPTPTYSGNFTAYDGG